MGCDGFTNLSGRARTYGVQTGRMPGKMPGLPAYNALEIRNAYKWWWLGRTQERGIYLSGQARTYGRGTRAIEMRGLRRVERWLFDRS